MRGKSFLLLVLTITLGAANASASVIEESAFGKFVGTDLNGQPCSILIERDPGGDPARALVTPNQEAPFSAYVTSHADLNRIYGEKETSSAGYVVRWYFNYVSVEFNEYWQPVSYVFFDNYSTWGRFIGKRTEIACTRLVSSS
jgi:hypothetical protein